MNTKKYNFDTILPVYNYNFLLNYSDEINIKTLHNAEKNIDRIQNQIILNSILVNIELAIKIELSIFEYALIYCHTRQFDENFIKMVYIDKFNEIYNNLTNSHGIINNTLKNDLLNNKIESSHIAFMSPSQLNEQNWIKEIKKKENKTL